MLTRGNWLSADHRVGKSWPASIVHWTVPKCYSFGNLCLLPVAFSIRVYSSSFAYSPKWAELQRWQLVMRLATMSLVAMGDEIELVEHERRPSMARYGRLNGEQMEWLGSTIDISRRQCVTCGHIFALATPDQSAIIHSSVFT